VLSQAGARQRFFSHAGEAAIRASPPRFELQSDGRFHYERLIEWRNGSIATAGDAEAEADYWQAMSIEEAQLEFPLGTNVRKMKGSQWHGTVVGYYSTDLTPKGVAIESAFERGSVQIYPCQALEPWDGR